MATRKAIGGTRLRTSSNQAAFIACEVPITRYITTMIERRRGALSIRADEPCGAFSACQKVSDRVGECSWLRLLLQHLVHLRSLGAQEFFEPHQPAVLSRRHRHHMLLLMQFDVRNGESLLFQLPYGSCHRLVLCKGVFDTNRNGVFLFEICATTSPRFAATDTPLSSRSGGVERGTPTAIRFVK